MAHQDESVFIQVLPKIQEMKKR